MEKTTSSLKHIINRRNFLKNTGALITGATLAVQQAAYGKGTGDKPNVLFICIDDLNDWVGCLSGHPQATTPHIDQLAKQGTLFTNAHCQAPVCQPSRACLMTSTYPSSSGL